MLGSYIFASKKKPNYYQATITMKTGHQEYQEEFLNDPWALPCAMSVVLTFSSEKLNMIIQQTTLQRVSRPTTRFFK